MISADSELSVMESIAAAKESSEFLTQREIARSTGLSLGMTNALLKRLAERGWVKLTRISTRTIRYALSPEGVAEIARRSAAYFRRSAKSAEAYRGKLESFVVGRMQEGIGTIVLVGPSDLDFLLEFICERHGVVFVKSADPAKARTFAKRPGVLLLDASGELGAIESGMKAISLEELFSGAAAK